MRASLARLNLMVPLGAVLLGMALIFYGTWLFSHPVGYIVGGVLVILAAIDARR